VRGEDVFKRHFEVCCLMDDVAVDDFVDAVPWYSTKRFTCEVFVF
jgi:hypothetical protein